MKLLYAEDETALSEAVLLVVLVGTINGLSRVLFEGQSDMVMNTLVDADGVFVKMDFDRQPPFMPQMPDMGSFDPAQMQRFSAYLSFARILASSLFGQSMVSPAAMP